MDWKKYTIITPQEALVALRTTEAGLGEAEANRRLLEYGKNTLQESETFWKKVLRQRSQSVLFWIFLLAAFATFFSGNILEAVCIFIFLLLNALLEIYQEFHSKKALHVLRHYLVPKALVWRESILTQVSSQSLVPGDIIELQAGDSIPADVRFFETEQVHVKETSIEKSRLKIEKQATSLFANPLSIEDAQNIGFAGTSLLTGKARAVVIATGAHTALGEIAYKSTLITKETSFEKNIIHFSRFLVKLVLMALVLVFILSFLIRGQQVGMGEMLVFTLVLAIAVIPETLPALTALILSRGSVRLAEKKLVMKRLSAIEDLGSIEILCTGKTGVLTENNLTVTHTEGSDTDTLLHYAMLAAHVVPTTFENVRDEFDRALWKKIGEKGILSLRNILRMEVRGFDSRTRTQSVVVRERSGNMLILRGSPEEILRRVDGIDSFTRKRFKEWITEAGYRGERVLAVATKIVPEGKGAHQTERNFVLQGFIAFLDPIKPDAKKAVALAQSLGVELKVFSGDSKEVVGAAAYASGVISNRDDVLTGRDFENLSLSGQLSALEKYAVFAGFSSEQKFSAIQLLQKSHTLGFLGDSMADMDTLQHAHVALVAEDAGDIAREASDILLLQKDLSVIMEGIQESRRIFGNILKYVKITLASNLGNFYSLVLAIFFLPYLPLLPLQILFLNFISDVPMLALATDTVDEEKLEHPKNQNIHAIIVTAAFFGMISTFFDLTFFKIFSHANSATLQTMWFLFSVVTEILLLYSLRSRRWFFKARRPSWAVIGLSVLAIVGAITLVNSSFGSAIGFEKLPTSIWFIIVGFAASYFVVTEIIKRWYYLHSALFVTRKNS